MEALARSSRSGWKLVGSIASVLHGVTWCYMVRKLRWFELPALLTDPQVLLFFLLSHCPSVRSCARQFEVVPVS